MPQPFLQLVDRRALPVWVVLGLKAFEIYSGRIEAVAIPAGNERASFQVEADLATCREDLHLATVCEATQVEKVETPGSWDSSFGSFEERAVGSLVGTLVAGLIRSIFGCLLSQCRRDARLDAEARRAEGRAAAAEAREDVEAHVGRRPRRGGAGVVR